METHLSDRQERAAAARAASGVVPSTDSRPGSQPQPPASPPDTQVVDRKQLRIVFGGLILALVMASLDQNIVATALPRIASELGGLAHISWVVTGFMVAATITTPLYGKLSDMYGRRRLFIVSITVFLGASLLCGLAQTMNQLIAFRALQGLGAGGLLTLSQTVIGDLVSPRERGRYQGLFTGAFAVSSVAGPVLGGVLTTTFSWRWVFLVNLPVGAVALVLIIVGLPASRRGARHEVDYAGALLLALSTASVLLLLSWGGSVIAWISPWTVLLLALAGTALFHFLRQERRAKEPVLNLSLFSIRPFVVCVIASGMMAFAMMGSLVFLPLYFQLVLGQTPTHAGLMMLPQVAMMLVSSIGGGQISSRTGRFKLLMLIGLGLEITGLVVLAVLAHLGAAPAAFLLALGILGLGMGVGMPNATVIVQNSVPRQALGAGTASMAFVRSLGGALGVALSGGIMAATLRAGLSSLKGGFDIQAFLEKGVDAIANLSAAQHAEVVDAYRGAIGASLVTGGIVMSVAFLLVLTMLRTPAGQRSAGHGGERTSRRGQS